MLLSSLFQNPLYLVIYLAAFIVGITIHEFAHAYVAYKSGDSTAKYFGRLTLNPLAHIDPMGALFFFLAGVGWAKPVPLDPRNLNNKSDELKVAFAGIAANIFLALVLALPLRYATAQGIAIDSSLGLSILNFFVEINLLLAAFNLLPIFPLDGSHLVEYHLDEDARNTYRNFGPYILIGLIMLNYAGIPILSRYIETVLRFLLMVVRGTYSG